MRAAAPLGPELRRAACRADERSRQADHIDDRRAIQHARAMDFRRRAAALAQFRNRLQHPRQGDFVDFHGAADVLEHRQGQFPAQMLAKLLQAPEHHRLVLVVQAQHLVGEQVKSQRLQQRAASVPPLAASSRPACRE